MLEEKIVECADLRLVCSTSAGRELRVLQCYDGTITRQVRTNQCGMKKGSSIATAYESSQLDRQKILESTRLPFARRTTTE
jgi:hypothetical protein